MRRYVIVGGGVAGHRAAIELRRLAPDSSITLISSEPGIPYDRPALTKSFLLGEKSEAEILLGEAESYARHGIAFIHGTHVDTIDNVKRTVDACGLSMPYDFLLLATGSRARALPDHLDAGDGLYVRTLADAARLKSRLVAGRRVAVIGGGFIGLEVAAAARTQGCEVTVIEAQASVMSRGMPALASAFMRELHQSNGVTVRCSETVIGIEWRRSGGATLTLGSAAIAADIVVYGLGVRPNVELAEKAGLRVHDGIVVDEGCRTSDPAILAAGEVTSHPSGRSGKPRRIESWRVASDQPLVAAANMTGANSAYRDAPWLWSDQYDVNLQVVGDVLAGDAYLVRGRINGKKWTLVAMDRGLPVGAAAVNNGRDISMIRRAINKGAGLPDDFVSECAPAPDGSLSYAAAGGA